MASAVRELKKAAIDPSIGVSDLLRKALVIANDLDLEEFHEWIWKELNGYSDGDCEKLSLPPYRILRCIVQAFNPAWGWRPVIFDRDPEMGERLSQIPIPYPIGRIEGDCDVHGSEDFAITFVAQTEAALRKAIRYPTEIRRFVDGASYHAIVDSVRNQILKWAMELEAAGVTGEGEEFTPEEKTSAQSATTFHFQNVGNVTFVRDVSSGVTVVVQQSSHLTRQQLDDLQQLLEEVERLKHELGLAQEELSKLETCVGAIKAELDKPEPDGGRIRTLLASLKAVVEGAAGGIVGNGILSVLYSLLK